jgi:hypothetical protein
MVRPEEKRPESQQETIDYRKIGCAFPGSIDDKKLLFHKQTVSINGFYATRNQEIGESGQQMYE